MRFKNKVLNLQVRYAKENGNYCDFVRRYKDYGKYDRFGNDESELIANLPGHCAMFLLCYLNGGSMYHDEFSLYFLQLYKREISELFESFLKENDCYDSYFKNIDLDFIKRNNIIKVSRDKCVDIRDFLYSNIGPYAFIMQVFYWEDTVEYRRYWSDMNRAWEKKLTIFINNGLL